jgi:hypothetical protein
MPGSPPKRRFHSSCVSTITVSAGLVLVGREGPPEHRTGAQHREAARRHPQPADPLGLAVAARFSSPGATAAIDSNAVVCRAQSRRRRPRRGFAGAVSGAWDHLSGVVERKRLSSTASTTLNIAVLAPIPSASVVTAAAVNAGAFRS